MRRKWNLIRAFNHEFTVGKSGEVVFGKKEREGEIYVGDVESASPSNVRANFTHVLHCIEYGVKSKFGIGEYPPDTRELILKGFNDWERENLIRHLPESFKFLDDAFKTNEKSRVLIHCLAGSSRSSAIACAYIMMKKGTTFDDTVKAMKSDRRIVHPNSGFRSQLTMFEIFDCKLNEDVMKNGTILTDEKHEFSDTKFKLMEEIEKRRKRKQENKKEQKD